MLTIELLQTFVKEAAVAIANEEQKRCAHERYIANRARHLQQMATYRMQHSAELKRRKRIYAKLVKSGARKQRRRISQGAMSYAYAGYK